MRFLITFLNCPCCCLLTHVCMPLDDDFWCNFLYFEQFFYCFARGEFARALQRWWLIILGIMGSIIEPLARRSSDEVINSFWLVCTRWTKRRAMMVKTVKRAWFLDFDFTCHFYWISSILYPLCMSFFLLLELFLYFECCFLNCWNCWEKKNFLMIVNCCTSNATSILIVASNSRRHPWINQNEVRK